MWQGKTIRYGDGPALFYQLSEIYISRTYDFRCSHQPRILDVGSNIGIAVRRYRERFPRAQITAFEPDPEVFSVLERNVRDNWQDSTSELMCGAAWIENGRSQFQSTGRDTGTLDRAGAIVVKTFDLAEYCRQSVDFLKLDVEGSEHTLIAHLAEAGVLRNVRALYIELHQWSDGAVNWHDTLATLQRCGFIYRITASLLGSFSLDIPFEAIRYPASLANVYAWQLLP
jgi:FkbM family methyltransferase